MELVPLLAKIATSPKLALTVDPQNQVPRGGSLDYNVMHTKPDLRVVLKWNIFRSGSVMRGRYRQRAVFIFVNMRFCQTVSGTASRLLVDWL